MILNTTPLEGVVLIEPPVHGDERGFFMESWRSTSYQKAGLPPLMHQSNYSRSRRGILRGLHYQHPQPQGKLVSVLEGEIFDVAVDIRLGSPTFGQWTGATLSAENHKQLYIPEDFAHGFCVTSDTALVHYMCTSEFAAEFDAAIAWNDPDIGIDWPITDCTVSAKDAAAPGLLSISNARLPQYEK